MWEENMGLHQFQVVCPWFIQFSQWDRIRSRLENSNHWRISLLIVPVEVQYLSWIWNGPGYLHTFILSQPQASPLPPSDALISVNKQKSWIFTQNCQRWPDINLFSTKRAFRQYFQNVDNDRPSFRWLSLCTFQLYDAPPIPRAWSVIVSRGSYNSCTLTDSTHPTVTSLT